MALSQQIVMSAAPIFRSSPSSDFSREALLRIADAGIKVVDCIRDLHACGSNLIIEVLGENNDFTEWEQAAEVLPAISRDHCTVSAVLTRDCRRTLRRLPAPMITRR